MKFSCSIYFEGNFEENFGENPSHLASVSLKGAETRLDYMGSCILMATLSGFKCNLEDIWQLPKVNEEELQGIFKFPTEI